MLKDEKSSAIEPATDLTQPKICPPARKRPPRLHPEPMERAAASPLTGDAGSDAAVPKAQPIYQPRRPKKSTGGHSHRAHHAMAAAGGGDDVAHGYVANLELDSRVIAEIIQLWRMRQRWHAAEKSLILQAKAVCRSWCAGDKEAANKLFGAPKDRPPPLQLALAPFLSASENFAKERKPIERRLKLLALSLPVSPWVADIKGFGQLNLAALVGEAGDIGSYRNPSCLWKRFGLAVIGGQRQRRVTDKDLAVIMGYSARRRAVAYLLGDCLIKNNKSSGQYRPLYDEHKAYQLARTDENKPRSLGHAHNRAARYMVKRVLRDLWAAWRLAMAKSKPIGPTPAASQISEQPEMQSAATPMPMTRAPKRRRTGSPAQPTPTLSAAEVIPLRTKRSEA